MKWQLSSWVLVVVIARAPCSLWMVGPWPFSTYVRRQSSVCAKEDSSICPPPENLSYGLLLYGRQVVGFEKRASELRNGCVTIAVGGGGGRGKSSSRRLWGSGSAVALSSVFSVYLPLPKRGPSPHSGPKPPTLTADCSPALSGGSC